MAEQQHGGLLGCGLQPAAPLGLLLAPYWLLLLQPLLLLLLVVVVVDGLAELSSGSGPPALHKQVKSEWEAGQLLMPMEKAHLQGKKALQHTAMCGVCWCCAWL